MHLFCKFKLIKRLKRAGEAHGPDLRPVRRIHRGPAQPASPRVRRPRVKPACGAARSERERERVTSRGRHAGVTAGRSSQRRCKSSDTARTRPKQGHPRVLLAEMDAKEAAPLPIGRRSDRVACRSGGREESTTHRRTRMRGRGKRHGEGRLLTLDARGLTARQEEGGTGGNGDGGGRPAVRKKGMARAA